MSRSGSVSVVARSTWGVRRALGLALGIALLMAAAATPGIALASEAVPMSYISFIGDSTYAGVGHISWEYKLHQRLDSRRVADSYYPGDGTDNRLTGTRWTFYNAAWGGKTLFWLYDGSDDRDGVWGRGSQLAATVTSRYIPGTRHWVFIGGGLNDLTGANATVRYADRVLALRYKIEQEVRAAGMIPVQCTLTPWGKNNAAPFATHPDLAHDLVAYFNASLAKHCGTTVALQDFYRPLADSGHDSTYWCGYRLKVGNFVHFTPLGKTRMANSVNFAALGLSPSDTSPNTVLRGTSGTLATRYWASTVISANLSADGIRLPGMPVTLESSADGTSSWRPAAAAISQPVPGDYQAGVACAKTRYYRFRFAGDALHLPAWGPVVRVRPAVSLTTPIAPAGVHHGTSFRVYGYVAPRHAAGSAVVRIYRFRYVSGAWKSYGYVMAKVSDYYGHSRYATSLSLPVRGKWRLWTYHPADADNGAWWSHSYDTVTVD